MGLKQKDTDSLFQMAHELFTKYKTLTKTWADDLENFEQAIELTSDMALNHFAYHDTISKRNKKISKNNQFVAPEERAIGTRWELNKKKVNGHVIQIPRQIQSTLQYVPILKTLRSLFENEEFASIYFDYNKSIKSSEIGRNGTKRYSCFNSGSVFAQNDFFANNAGAIQLLVSIDDFEPNNPLQSKANCHKICAVYFSIHNLPFKYQSKLENIHLVCLVNSDDLKTKQTDINNIWQMVVDELAVLETKGIDVRGQNIKGTLVHMAFDNLGGNQSQGFSGGFNANKYCRNCLSSKEECQRFVSDSQCDSRTLESYEQSLDIIEQSESVDLYETNGVKFYCVLNDLEHFHTVMNLSADIMHDLNEGCIPKFLVRFLKLCIDLDVFTLDELDSWIKCYDYGVLNSANIPSKVSFEKRCLGQNASQSICLFRHLPFILHDFKNHTRLQKSWNCFKALLQICEIVYSYGITELDLQNLDKQVKLHLNLYLKLFKEDLHPKHHFLLHYARIIRAVGPLRHFNMLRFDAKHRTFKTLRHATRNFKSINKTLAQQHQKQHCLNGFNYKDKIVHGVWKLIENISVVNTLQNNNLYNIPNVALETKYLHYNNYKYSRSLMIVHNYSFCKILHIVRIDEKLFFICLPYKVKRFNSFLNSFEVEMCNASEIVIDFLDLMHAKSYELKSIDNKSYVICDSLDLKENLVH